MIIRHNFRFCLLFGIALGLFVLGACSRGEDTDVVSEGAQSPASIETDSLVVYTYDAFPRALRDALTTHFAEEFGVTVDLQRLADTGALFNQLYLERENPRADVVIGLDATYLSRVYELGLTVPYRPDAADEVNADLIVDDQFRVVPFDYGGISLNYDSAALPDPPGSWDELTDERFRSSIVMLNPATSSPGRNFLLLTVAVFGDDGFEQFWRQLRPNVLTVTGGWTDGYGLYVQGEAPMVVSYDTSPAYHIEYEDTDRYRPLIFDDEVYLQIEVAGVVNRARNELNARRAIEFILSREFQELIPLNQFMFPVRDDVELPAAFTAYPRAASPVVLPPDVVAENFEDWLARWEAIMR